MGGNRSDLRPGQRVTWIRAPGKGYGYTIPVAALVTKLGDKRVQIEIRSRPRPGAPWQSSAKWVEPTSLRPRITPSAAFNEPMTVSHLGFQLGASKRPGVKSTLFPMGIFYATIDGRELGAPCLSEENAVRSAFISLEEGQYAVHLRDHIDHQKSRIAADGSASDAIAELADLQARLQKVTAAGFAERKPALPRDSTFHGMDVEAEAESQSGPGM